MWKQRFANVLCGWFSSISIFCSGGARPPVSEMIAFIKEHRKVCGIEPICHVLQIALSTFYAHLAVENDPDKALDRAKRDAEFRLR